MLSREGCLVLQGLDWGGWLEALSSMPLLCSDRGVFCVELLEGRPEGAGGRAGAVGTDYERA